MVGREKGRERERDLLQRSHITLWEHSSHDRLIVRGVPGVSFVFRQCRTSLFGLPQGKIPSSHMKDQVSNPGPHTPRPVAQPVIVA